MYKPRVMMARVGYSEKAKKCGVIFLLVLTLR